MITAMDKLNRRLENRLHIIQGDPLRGKSLRVSH